MSGKVVVTVSEMARMVGLSRARFYQLMKAGIFPEPLRSESTNRPVFDQHLQEICLQVKRTNCGINGQPVLFYSRRPTKPMKKQPKKERVGHSELIEGLKSLGLATATDAQVGKALATLYPQGTGGHDPAEVLRTLFLHLMKESK